MPSAVTGRTLYARGRRPATVQLMRLSCRGILSLRCSSAVGWRARREPSYELQGQIVAVDAARQEMTVKHGDIKGFMPGMTMAYKVKQASLMTGKTPGDLVRATLVVEESLGYLTSVEVTGTRR